MEPDELEREEPEPEDDGEEEWVAEVPLSYLVAVFCAAYPGMWANPAYPTRDHIIPAAWWDVLWTELPSVEDRQALRAAHAHAHGEGLVQQGQSFAVRSYTRQLHRRAFPTYYRKRGE